MTAPHSTTTEAAGLDRADLSSASAEQRFLDMAEHLPGVVYCYDYHDDGTRDLHFLGPGLEQLIGPRLAAEVRADFSRLFTLLHPDDKSRVAATATASAESHEPFDVECRLQRDDGGWCWVRAISRARPLTEHINRWHVVVVDINAQKNIEDRRRRLMTELNHRVKNNLAAVLSLAEHTCRNADTLDEFRAVFTERIRSMAAIHEALSRGHWDCIGLRDLVALSVGPHMHGHELVCEGMPLELPARQATTLGQVLHELVINAVKHGCLGAADGRIVITWTCRPSDDVQIVWRETGGPEMDVPVQAGTGLSLVGGLVRHDLRGSVRLDATSQGFVCTIVVPEHVFSVVRSDGDSEAGSNRSARCVRDV